MAHLTELKKTKKPMVKHRLSKEVDYWEVITLFVLPMQLHRWLILARGW